MLSSFSWKPSLFPVAFKFQLALFWLALLVSNSVLLLLQVHYLMVLSANWAYVKDACRMQKYEDIKSKEEQELHDIHSTRSKERLNAYT